MTKHNLGFNHNNFEFADRLLRLEIVSNNSLGFQSYRGVSKRKLRSHTLKDKQIGQVGDATLSNNDLECSANVKVTTLSISSAVLAAKSPFFATLFQNGMRESQQNHFTLRITASEEAALMDLLNFMYSYTLRATTPNDLLNVLIIADKFEVISCMRYCSDLLMKEPMSLESALLYLDLPPSVLMAETMRPLKDKANHHLSQINKLEEEAMPLSLSAVKDVLGRDELHVKTEDTVVEFILKWARAHYPNSEEYREILNNNLVPLIRFPYMTSEKLSEVSVNPDLNREVVSNLVREALLFKSGLLDKIPFEERVYLHRPIKLVQFDFRWPRCVARLDLRKKDCENLFSSNHMFSQQFSLGGRTFCLMLRCYKDVLTLLPHLGLFIYMDKRCRASYLSYEFEVMKRPSNNFQSMHKVDNISLFPGKSTGKDNLLGISWTEFMADDEYFIDGILRIRVELTIKI